MASQLRSTELANWVTQELDGYKSQEDLPDYRVIDTGCFGVWTNGYWMVRGRGVPMSKIKNAQLKKFLTKFPVTQGIRTVEEHAAGSDLRFGLSADITGAVNQYVAEDGYGYAEIQYAVAAHDFAQILDTVRNRLLDFVLKLDENWPTESKPPSRAELSNLMSVVIYNSSQGANMSAFDQRGQQVQYQYNAAGNISVNNIADRTTLAIELEKLKEEIERAKDANAVNSDVAVEAEYHLLQAAKEARKKDGDTTTFSQHVGKAQDVLKNMASVAGLVSTIVKITEIASAIFR